MIILSHHCVAILLAKMLIWGPFSPLTCTFSFCINPWYIHIHIHTYTYTLYTYIFQKTRWTFWKWSSFTNLSFTNLDKIKRFMSNLHWYIIYNIYIYIYIYICNIAIYNWYIILYYILTSVCICVAQQQKNKKSLFDKFLLYSVNT